VQVHNSTYFLIFLTNGVKKKIIFGKLCHLSILWNENWGISMDDGPHLGTYGTLYRTTYAGLLRASQKFGLPGFAFRLGGPVTMQMQYTGAFAREMKGLYSFISSHLYPTDPNCTSTPEELVNIDCFADTIAAGYADAAAYAPPNTPFLTTEYNSGLFNRELLNSPYSSAFLARQIGLLAEKVPNLKVLSFWTFSDIFEESGQWSDFEGYAYGIQTASGIKKPSYRFFELLSDINTARIPLAGSQPPAGRNNTVFSWSVLSSDNKTLSIFLSNFAPDGSGISVNPSSVVIQLLPANANPDQCSATFGTNVTSRSIDRAGGDSHSIWRSMGSPAYPTRQQVNEINNQSNPRLEYLTLDSSSCEIKLQLAPYAAVRLDVNIQ
jgi:xylan 1,4-beta-xylosidase